AIGIDKTLCEAGLIKDGRMSICVLPLAWIAMDKDLFDLRMNMLYLCEVFFQVSRSVAGGEVNVADRVQGLSCDFFQASFHLVLDKGNSLSQVVLECAFRFVLKFCERSILHVGQHEERKQNAY